MRINELVMVKWTRGFGFFAYNGGWWGWKWVIAFGPVTIFLRWHDMDYWQAYRLKVLARTGGK
jgi:hypothetical protein